MSESGMESPRTQNILIVGVGGQGVVLASDILATVCLARGYDVKKSEVHGMAKRGGIVYSHLRYGPAVLSPLIEAGGSDVLLAFEPAEALRWSKYLKPSGTMIVNLRKLVPQAACQNRRPHGAPQYPEGIQPILRRQFPDLRALDADSIATELGNPKACNTVLLGVLSTVCEFSAEDWLGAIEKTVRPRTVEINRRAFLAGRSLQFSPGHETPAVGPPERRDAESADVPYVEIRGKWCKGCEICVVVCPQNCLQMNDANKAEMADSRACIRCMLCEWLCPDLAVSVH